MIAGLRLSQMSFVVVLFVAAVSRGQSIRVGDDRSAPEERTARGKKDDDAENAGRQRVNAGNDQVPVAVQRYLESQLGLATRVRMLRTSVVLPSPLMPPFLEEMEFSFAKQVPQKTDLFYSAHNGATVATQLRRIAAKVEVGKLTLTPAEVKIIADARMLLYIRKGVPTDKFETYLTLKRDVDALQKEFEEEEQKVPPNRAAIMGIKQRLEIAKRQLDRRSVDRDRIENALEDLQELEVDAENFRRSANSWKELLDQETELSMDMGAFADLSGWISVTLPIDGELMIECFDSDDELLEQFSAKNGHISFAVKKARVEHAGGAMRSDFLRKRFWRSEPLILSDGDSEGDAENELLPRYVGSLVIGKSIEFTFTEGAQADLAATFKKSNRIRFGGFDCPNTDHSSLFIAPGYVAFLRPAVLGVEVVESPKSPDPDPKYFSQ